MSWGNPLVLRSARRLERVARVRRPALYAMQEIPDEVQIASEVAVIRDENQLKQQEQTSVLKSGPVCRQARGGHETQRLALDQKPDHELRKGTVHFADHSVSIHLLPTT